MSRGDYTGFTNGDQHVPPTTDQGTFEPIAVIGFAHKLPQDITSADSLWKLLMERRTTMTEVPMNRWNIDGFYRSHGNRPSTVKNRGGHFLIDDPGRFDAPFFSITPAEAECMDPQQRFLLETTYHALENAGIPMNAAMGSSTSVHVGCLLQEYSQISQRDAMPGTYQIIGSSGLAMLANRVSWFYDLKGPSMTIDTACSGSLVALHLACQELNSGSVNMALACGSNLCLLPDSCSLLSQLNMMSPDGLCHSFDERANGYAKSEGFGVLVLKRVSQAVQDGDTIRAVIRATGCNSDGRTPSITSPSQKAQEKLIRETYKRGGLSLDNTRFFEAHGTGTPVGDPCEASTISNVFVTRTNTDQMYVGALKSNLGHSEGASGVAGVIKTILALEKGIIPPNVSPERVNPKITSTCRNLRFPLTPVEWPTDGVRRASVNAFGYGGTNAHVVLDDALSFLESRGLKALHHTRRLRSLSRPVLLINGKTNGVHHHSSVDENGLCNAQLAKSDGPTHKLLVLSAFDESAVHRSVNAHLEWLRSLLSHEDPASNLSDLAHTLSNNRTSFPWKSFCVAGCDPISDHIWSAPVRAKQRLDLCFVFTGQGAQWHGMGHELMKYAVFRDSLMKADRFFISLGSGWSMLEELYRKSKHDVSIDSPDLSQPLCTALQIAMVELLRSWNIRPSTIVGHSSGEIVAAYATGAVSRESAWTIAFLRGLAVVITREILQSTGAMVAVQATPEILNPILDYHNREHPEDRVSIACYNSPSNLTVSGSRDAVHQLSFDLTESSITFKILNVDVAYHSRHMSPVATVYGRLLRIMEPGEQHNDQAKFVSTVTGKSLEDTAVLRTSSYWIENLTSPVKFSSAMTKILAGGKADFIVEVGPHSTLSSPLRDILSTCGRSIKTDYCSVLRRGQMADRTAKECAGNLYALGFPVDIGQVNNDASSNPKMLVNLPSYPFSDKTKYWLEGRTSKQYRFREHLSHELLGTRSDDWNPHEARWINRIVLDPSSYLLDHQINGSVLLPAAGMLVMAIEAVRQFYAPRTPVRGYKMKDVTFLNAITISPQSNGTEVQLTLRPSQKTSGAALNNQQSETSWAHFSIFMYESAGWTLCCSGAIAVEYAHEDSDSNEGMGSHKTALKRCQVNVDSSDIYNAFEKAGLVYGRRFRAMQHVREIRATEATGIVGLNHWREQDQNTPTDPHLIHPAALDAILQMSFPAYSIYAKNASATTLPTGFRRLWISEGLANARPDSQVSVRARVIGRGFRNKMFAITAALTTENELCFSSDMETTTIGRSTSPMDTPQTPTKNLYKIVSKPDVDLLPRKTLHFAPSPRENPPMLREKELLCHASIRNALDKLPHSLHHPPDHLQHHIKWTTQQPTPHIPEPHESLQTLCNQLQDPNAEPALLVRVAQNLNTLRTPHPHALALTLADNVRAHLHSHADVPPTLLSSITAHLDLLAHKYPGMRVLEVGAGMGAATSHVVKALQNRVAEYVYTESTAGLLGQAEERLAPCMMVFRVLDVQGDVGAQGFGSEGFDLVVAAYDPCLDSGLQEGLLRCYRSLLLPHGRVVLFKQQCRSLAETFMLGWVPGSTPNMGAGHGGIPPLGSNDLDQLLIECGFSGIDVSVRDHMEEDEGVALLAAISTVVSLPAGSTSTVTVILDHCSHVQTDLLGEIRKIFSAQYDMTITAISWSAAAVHNPDLRDTTCIFLPSLDSPQLDHLNDETLEMLKHIISTTSTLICVSATTPDKHSNPSHHLIPGLVRTLATEAEDNRLVSLSLDAHSGPEAMARHITSVARTFAQPRAVYEDEFVEVDGLLCIPRVVDDTQMAAQVAGVQQAAHTVTTRWGELERPHLSIRAAGYLNTLFFEHVPPSDSELAADEVVVEVQAAGLSKRDLLVAMGQAHDEVFGNDIAGLVKEVGAENVHGFAVGDRVFGVARDGVAQLARCKAFQMRRIPQDVDFIEAATYPTPYCIAYHGLVNCAGIRKGEVVVIHDGAGGLGQAAIQLAQLYGCGVIVSIKSSEERTYLRDACGIPESHLLSSRSPNLAQDIQHLTNGRRVDVVFTLATGDSSSELWDCLAPFGRFIEIKESDAFTSTVNASKAQYKPPARNNCISISVDFQELMQHEIFAGIFREVAHLIESKRLPRPTQVQVYKQSGVEAAFRALQDAENPASVVVEMANNEMVQMELAPAAKPLFDPESTYLIAGAFGGIGECVTRWMVRHGAKHLILPSRSAVEGTSSHRKVFVDELRAAGAVVKVPVCDIANRAQLERTLKELEDMPSIKGCVQAAMVLRDSSFANMTAEKWNQVLAPKVAGSWNLHDLLPGHLDFFIMMSSSTGIMGSFGQSNYTAGNTYQDALAAHRVKHGQHAVALAFSMVVGVGYVAQNTQVQALLRVRGMLEEVTLDDIYKLMTFCCDAERMDAARVGPQMITSLTLPADLRAMNIVAPLGSTRPLYSYLDTLPSHYDQKGLKETKKLPSSLLPAATRLCEAIAIITEAIQDQLSGLLVVSRDDIDIKNAVHMYGVDSLVAVEMKNWFAKGVGADVSTTEILGDVSIEVLAGRVAARSRFVKDDLKE